MTIFNSASEDAALRAIIEGVGTATGADYFPALVRSMAGTLDMPYVFVTELAGDRRRLRCLAGRVRGAVTADLDLPIVGTPAEPCSTRDRST